MKALTLLVPALVETVRSETGAQVPHTRRLLARAARRPASSGDGDRLLLEQFGVAQDRGDDAPIGPLSLLGEGIDPGDQCWLRADPVHLQADQDRVLLVTAEQLEIDQGEAEAFCQALQAHFAADGLTFLCPHPQRWYVGLDTVPAIRTATLAAVRGRNVHAHLPTGADAGKWRGLLNEAQMLLHGSEPNRARSARGLPSINSLWFYGAGRLPATCTATAASARGDNPLLRGLARCAGIPYGEPPADPAEWLARAAPGRHLVALAPALDAEAAVRLERHWVRPLWAALRRRRLRRLELWPGGEEWLHTTPTRAWLPWAGRGAGAP